MGKYKKMDEGSMVKRARDINHDGRVATGKQSKTCDKVEQNDLQDLYIRAAEDQAAPRSAMEKNKVDAYLCSAFQNKRKKNP